MDWKPLNCADPILSNASLHSCTSNWFILSFVIVSFFQVGLLWPFFEAFLVWPVSKICLFSWLLQRFPIGGWRRGTFYRAIYSVFTVSTVHYSQPFAHFPQHPKSAFQEWDFKSVKMHLAIARLLKASKKVPTKGKSFKSVKTHLPMAWLLKAHSTSKEKDF